MDDGKPQNVFQLETAGLTRLGIEALQPGDTWTLPGGRGTLEFVDVARWASFRIAYDPGRWLALIGAVLAIIGLSMSLFVRRRRIWLRVDPRPVRGRERGGDRCAGGYRLPRPGRWAVPD